MIVLLCAVVMAVPWPFVPRGEVGLPRVDASPEQVVTAYARAIEVRDFETANAIDSRPNSDLGWFSRPFTMSNVSDLEARINGDRAYVTFVADFKNDQGTMNDGDMWGLYLGRSDDGRWQIVDAGLN